MLLCTLDWRLFLGSSLILVHALHATRLGRTRFSTRSTFFRGTVNFVNFCTLNWSQDFVLFRGLHEDFVARRPEALWTNCHACSTPPLNFCHFSLRLDCSSVRRCIQAHFLTEFTGRRSSALTIQASTSVEIVYIWMLVPSVLSNLLPIFPFSVSLKPETSWLFILQIHSFWKSVRIPVDGLFRNFFLQNKLKIEKIFLGF